MTADTVTAFLAAHGLWLLAPLALVEGPLVTIAAAALASKGILPLPAVIAIATAADLAGDTLLWIVGRKLRHALPRSLHRRIARAIPPRHMRRNACCILTLGKFTHSAGAVVLVAAGMARVPFLRFLCFNLAATLPKVAALAAIGWTFGVAFLGQGGFAVVVPPILFVATLALVALWLRPARKPPCASVA